MRDGALGLERLADEKPARAGLDGDVDLAVGEALDPVLDGLRCRGDATAVNLARLLVEGVEGDLRSVHVESGYDRHRGLLSSSGYCQIRANYLALSGGGPCSFHLRAEGVAQTPLLSGSFWTIPGMTQNFITCDRDQELLLPPSLKDWLPDDHLAWFVLEAVDELDLSDFYAFYRADGWGRAAHDPKMMVALYIYAYSIGVRSARAIERRCQEDVAFRVICAGQTPPRSGCRASRGGRACARARAGRSDPRALGAPPRPGGPWSSSSLPRSDRGAGAAWRRGGGAVDCGVVLPN
jgi:hypothetical protein